MRPLALVLPVLAALPAAAQDSRPEDDPVEALEKRTAEIARSATRAVVAVSATTDPPAGPQLAFPGLRIAPHHRADVPEGTKTLAEASGDVEPGRRPFGWLLAATPGAEPDIQLATVRPAFCQ